MGTTIDQGFADRIEKIRQIVKPRNKQIAVIKDRLDERTDAGVYLTEASRSIKGTGRVVRCSDDCADPMPEGTRIHFNVMCSNDMTIGGEDIVLIKESNILCEISTEDVVQGGAR